MDVYETRLTQLIVQKLRERMGEISTAAMAKPLENHAAYSLQAGIYNGLKQALALVEEAENELSRAETSAVDAARIRMEARRARHYES
jgi:hypothetical protein